MATRNVSIKVILDGYQEYRNTIAKLNAQNKLLESQLKSIDLEYGKNSKSLEAVAEKQKLLQALEQNYSAKIAATSQALDTATQAMNFYAKAVLYGEENLTEATKAIEEYKNGTYEGSESLKELEEKQNKASQELSEATRMYTQSVNEVARLTKERDNETKALGDVKDRQAELNGETKESIKIEPEQRNEVQKTIDVWKRMVDILGWVKDGIGKVKDGVMNSINAFIDYEAAFANVEKTVDGSQRQLDKLNQQIKDLSSTMPFAAKDIAQVASLAGQLGVNVDDIGDFTEVMLGLGVATNITADDASTLVAQFQNITGFPMDKVKNIASTIIELGNNSATTEADIINMAQRFASAGTLAGLSAQEILGMSAALSSVGVRAEAGGTTLSKMVQMIQNAVEHSEISLEEFAKSQGKTTKQVEKEWNELQEPIKQFAKVAGVSADEFAKAWKESPVEAINMFLAGLHGTFEEGDSVLALLDELGINEVRLRNSVSALAASEKDLAYYVDMANNAFKDTSAYDKEVGRFLDTTKSNVEILKNNFELLKMQIGEALSPAFDGLVGSLGTLIGTISTFLENHPFIIDAITAIFGILSGGIDIINTIISSMDYMVADSERFGEVANGTKDVINDSTRAYYDQVAAIDGTREEAQKYLDILKNLEADGKITKEEQEEYNDAIAALKELYPELNTEIDKNTGMLKDGADALQKQIDGWRDLAIAEARSQKLQKLYSNLYEVQDELAENVKKFKKNAPALEALEKQAGKYKEELLELERAYDSGEITTYEYEQRHRELEDAIEDCTGRAYELRQEQTDLEEAIRNGRKAIEENETAIHNWEESTKRATKTTDDNTEANKRNAESYDQSKESAENGEKTIKAFVDGQLKYFTTEEWQNYKKSVKNKTNEVLTTAGTDANAKGKEIMKSFANGILASQNQVKEAGKQINNVLTSTLRSTNLTWKLKVQNGTANYVAMFAEGGIVTQATNAIVGEAGAEAIIPLKQLPDIMSQMMTNQETMNGFNRNLGRTQQTEMSQVVSLLNRYLPQMSNMQVVMDGNRLVGTLAPKIDNYFTNQVLAEGRGQ